jgi:hypothetical protein
MRKRQRKKNEQKAAKLAAGLSQNQRKKNAKS